MAKKKTQVKKITKSNAAEAVDVAYTALLQAQALRRAAETADSEFDRDVVNAVAGEKVHEAFHAAEFAFDYFQR